MNEKHASGVAVTEHDLLHLWKLVEEKDGGPAWIQMMDRSTPTMSYQAWRRDPEVFISLFNYESINQWCDQCLSEGVSLLEWPAAVPEQDGVRKRESRVSEGFLLG